MLRVCKALPDDYVVIDIETTGLLPVNSEIIEIAAIRIKDGVCIDTFSTLIRPVRTRSIPAEITEINGITNDMVIGAPTFKEIEDDFFDFIKDTPLVGHNIIFDFKFIGSATIENRFKSDFCDTLDIAREKIDSKYVANYKLATLVDLFEIESNEHHRALSDCYDTYRLFEILKKTNDDNIQDFIPEKPKKPSLISRIKNKFKH